MSNEVQKIITVGTEIELLSETSKQHTVVDAGIGIPDTTGNYAVGFWIKDNSTEEISFIPYAMILDLLNNGLLWKVGKDESARRLHDLREKQNPTTEPC